MPLLVFGSLVILTITSEAPAIFVVYAPFVWLSFAGWCIFVFGRKALWLLLAAPFPFFLWIMAAAVKFVCIIEPNTRLFPDPC